MVDCLIAFGANEGDPESNFRQVIELLRTTADVEVTAVGEPCKTEPIGGPSRQLMYLNASIRLATTLSAEKLHQRLIEIENELGRERGVRWGSRSVDLDLLLYGDQQIRTETLTVPHPRMSFRRFVLEPCLKVAGEMTHPTSGKTITELLEILNQRADIAVFVNAKPTFLKSLTKQEGIEDWKFVQVSNVNKLRELESTAKLIVVLSGADRSMDLVAEALKFPGPMLDLRTSKQPVEEVIAALAASSD